MKQGTDHRVRIEHIQGGFSFRTEIIKTKCHSVFLYPPSCMQVKMMIEPQLHLKA
jgi:hypothetical protein